jgi:dCMP deaminase
MTERPSFEAIYMAMAHSVSLRSTCLRTDNNDNLMHVGCVIVSPDFRKMIALGYNGNASGLPNKCDTSTPGACGCIHAEANAAVNCDVPRSTEKVVFCTHLPCSNCAKLLINLGGVKHVHYKTDYHTKTSLGLFQAVGIGVSQLGD